MITRDNYKNVLDYCDFEGLCVVISKSPVLSHNMLNEEFKFTPSIIFGGDQKPGILQLTGVMVEMYQSYRI